MHIFNEIKYKLNLTNYSCFFATDAEDLAVFVHSRFTVPAALLISVLPASFCLNLFLPPRALPVALHCAYNL